jgi:outer membrane protein
MNVQNYEPLHVRFDHVLDRVMPAIPGWLAAALVVLSLLALPAPVNAGAGDWTLRLGASKYHPKGKNGEFENPLVPSTDLELDVENGSAPTFDLSRMLTDRWGLELMVQLPARHVVKFEHGPTAVGNATIGEVKRMTAVLNAQYHLLRGGWLRPYLGAGLQASFFFDEEGRDYLEDANLEFDDAIGLDVQAGVDVMLSERWLLNGSARYLWNESELAVNGEKYTKADITGLLWGLHLGYRF